MTAFPKAGPIKPGDRLGLTLFLATVIHAIVILGVSFGADLKARVNLPSLDVVLVQTAFQTAPDKANYIAQFNQQASGTTDAKLRPTSPVLGPKPIPTAGQAPIASNAAVAAQAENLGHRSLTQERADRQVLDEQQHPPQEVFNAGNSRAQLNLELARLTSELSEETQRYAQRPRVNYLDTVSAKTAVEAAYIQAWVDKVERVGNLNYPDDARRRKLSGRLVVHVLLDNKGEIVKASIGSPSGQQVLDDAAMRIVKLAAPFKPFSDAMREEYDQLMITRTWIFRSDGELTTR
jgi:protein TonB